MTIGTIQSQTTIPGNGVTNPFSYNFLIPTAGSANVIYTDGAGVDNTLTPSQYTITGIGSAAGGSVTYPKIGSPITAGTYLTIQRVLLPLQTTSINNQGPTFAAIENALDYLTMLMQQIGAASTRYRGTWASGLDYQIGDFVVDGANGTNTGNIYYCAIANTSGTWATDLAAGDWIVFVNISAVNTDAAAAAASAAAAQVSATAATASELAAQVSATAATASATAATASAAAATASATSASASAAAAAASALAASAGNWLFSTTTTMTDPGTGNIQFDNATISSATNIAISALSNDSGNPNMGPFIVQWGASTNSNRGYLTIRKSGSPSTFAVFAITGSVTDNSTWQTFAVSYVAGAGTFSAADVLVTGFSRSGDAGSINAGVTGSVAYYSASGSAVTGLATASSSVLISRADGSPGWTSSTASNQFLGWNGTTMSFGKVNMTTGVTGTLAGTNGGTNNAFIQFSGPSTSMRTLTVPDRSDTFAMLGTTQSFTAATRGTTVSLSCATTISIDFNLGNNFSCSMTTNATLGTPTNMFGGQSGVIAFIQDATGSRTLAYASVWKFAGGSAPTLSTAAGSIDLLTYYAETTTRVTGSLIKGSA